MKRLVKDELVKLVDSFQDSTEKLKYRNYSIIIDTFARGKYAVIIHYPNVFFDDDLFDLIDFAKKHYLSCFFGSNSNIFLK